MIVSAEVLAEYLAQKPEEQADPFIVSPLPDLERVKAGGASIDLRLGTWFLSLNASRMQLLDVYHEDSIVTAEAEVTSKHYVPFGGRFILHPKRFVLAITLEWLRMPLEFAGMVTGKSSWGRRGLIIETAPGIHPGFNGCLALELTNVGEVPIAISPGTEICQLFVHKLDKRLSSIPGGKFFGQRQPTLTAIVPDEFCKNLMKKL